jgi:pyruvate dehydrogenase E2 component (dihydrolipoamide acetyltransferase)
MISEVVMPQMGADMTEGTIVRWLKKEGDQVKRGEIIAEIETDKANVEIEAFESGLFRKILAQEGATIEVGKAIAIIAGAEDDISQYGAGVSERQPALARPTTTSLSTLQESRSEQMPEAKASAQSGEAPRADGRVRASPVARRMAKERGLDLTKLRGTGPDGRIVRRDVEAAKSEGQAALSEPAPDSPRSTPEIVAMGRMRQTIARRMSQSKREAPHYYVTVDIDMADAERMRHQINDARHGELHISVNDILVKACALALQKHPMFNVLLVDGQPQRHDQINICIAIALEDGLIAPAILGCQSKSLIEISSASKDLSSRAKSGTLKADEYSAGTFTVSNLGMFDVETLIAIIQPPQTAILGVGAVRDAAIIRDSRVEATKLMKVALSADHRVTDGAQGARFLKDIQRLLENPIGVLV